VPPVGFRRGSGEQSRPEADDTFSEMCYFEPVLMCMHLVSPTLDSARLVRHNNYDMKWKKIEAEKWQGEHQRLPMRAEAQ